MSVNSADEGEGKPSFDSVESASRLAEHEFEEAYFILSDNKLIWFTVSHQNEF